jgi:NADH:ubiquinone oxidoreductase subunit F (NADH-binding)
VPLHRLESLSTYYTHFRRRPPAGRRLAVCRDLSCHLAGAEAACERLRAALAERDEAVEIERVSCLGRCEQAPAAALGEQIVRSDRIEDVVRVLDGQSEPVDDRPAADWGEAKLYAGRGQHFSTLRAALDADPAELARVLEEAALRGMGGAAFATGRKWSLVAAEPANPKFVICNADESEPGTFKDREILRDLPHLVLEGMALAGWAIGAERGIVFIRHEYAPERRALERAIADARADAALGQDVFGRGFHFDVEVFVSPGGYILGEETALLECLEDRRGEPRNKPPFPGTVGLFGQPTLINNVETFVHATGILARGAPWWRGLGEPGHAGHKFISVSGDVERPGVYLVPFGTSIGGLLERCGGMRAGRRLGAIAPGGASSNFLPPDRLDVALDFETLQQAGSMLGSGAVIFLADDHDLLEVGLNVARFFRNESCGKCVPCRVGSEKAVKLVEQAGVLSGKTLARVSELHATLARTSICGLGQVALAPLLSLAEHFPDLMRGE